MHDNLHSLRKGIPTNTAPAPSPADAHPLRIFFLGSIVSELIQSLLPHRTSQLNDIAKVCLLESGIGLYVAYHLEKYYPWRSEQVSMLYRPMRRRTCPPVSILTRTSQAHNCSRFTINPIYPHPRCPRRITTRIRSARQLRARC